MINQAKEFAIKAHGDQTYGDKPYIYHLDRVFGVLQRFGVSKTEILEAAYLHDVLEDTDVTIDEIDYQFGLLVGDLVNAVTNEKGSGRTEALVRTYAKINNIGQDAVILKLSDRIANVEECWREIKLNGRSSLFKRYKTEMPAFKKALQKDESDIESRMWEWLGILLNASLEC